MEQRGFLRQEQVDGELRDFLGLGPNEGIARTTAISRICDYIRQNNLYLPENSAIMRMRFQPDQRLADLLGTQEVTSTLNIGVLIRHRFTRTPRQQVQVQQ